MGTGPRDVLGKEPAVKTDRGVDRLHDRVWPGGETPAPHRVLGPVGHRSPPEAVMRWFVTAVLYTAIALGANAAAAYPAALAALREGSMKKLAVHDVPVAAPDIAFTTRDGAEHRLSDWRGRVLLVNFWATWCAPCRRELPALEALNRDLGGDD